MGIKRRGDSWQVDLSYGKPAKRIRRSFTTESAAKRWKALTLQNLDRGIEPESGSSTGAVPTTLGQLREVTLRSVWRGTRGETTAATNSGEVVEILGATRPLAALDATWVGELTQTLVARGQKPATVNRKLAAFSRMLSFAQQTGAIAVRPTVTRLKEPQGRTRWLSWAEQDDLFDELGDEAIRRLCVFLVETGVRVSDALRVRWGDIIPAGERWAVEIKQPKNDEPRAVPIVATLAAELDALRHLPDGPFQRIPQSRVNTVWNAAKARVPWAADDAEVVPHCLRHTCASRLVQAGVDILTVRRWMGHKTLRVTMRYAHLAPDFLTEAWQRAEAFKPVKSLET